MTKWSGQAPAALPAEDTSAAASDDQPRPLRVGERTGTIEETATGVIATVCPGAPQTCH
jgi:hypothetical protein